MSAASVPIAVSASHQVNFAVGAAGALSGWMFVHPFDLLKVRQQLAGEAKGPRMGLSALAKDIVAKEGAFGLYGGLSAAVARQLTYGNMRLGFYQTFKDVRFAAHFGRISVTLLLIKTHVFANVATR